MFLYHQRLIDKLRSLCDKSQKKIWIITPFIGSWSAIEKILGRKWITDDKIKVRLLTDIKNESFISPESFEKFRYRANIKTLRGLHAKLYIIDDSAIITSANLTGTAFSRRYELGFLYEEIPEELKSLVKNWWEFAEEVDPAWVPEKPEGTKNEENANTQGLRKLWKLPKLSTKIVKFKNFDVYLNAYRDFKDSYLQVTTPLLPELQIYQEIDLFFNYLFHEHPQVPSRKYKENTTREITDKQKKEEIEKYLKKFKNWLGINSDFASSRKKRIERAKKILHPDNISSMNTEGIEEIIDSLHCMNSLPLNKTRFLTPQNNSIDTIKLEWSNLLHGLSLPVERMENCSIRLKYFGKSSIQELVALYYPDKYPVINTNSNSGMRFFGYDLKKY